MDKKLILAIVLSIIVLIGFNVYFANQTAKQKPIESKEIQKEEIVSPVEKQKEVSQTVKESKSTKKKEFEEKDVEVNTDLLKVVFTTKGAKIKNWILKNYKESDGKLIDLAGGLNIDVNNTSEFEYKCIAIVVSEAGYIERVPFTYTSKDLRITKEFLFKDDSYKVDCSVKIENLSNKEVKVNNFLISLGPGLGSPEKIEEFEELVVSTFIDDKIKKDKIKKIKEDIINRGDISWIAISKKFFVASIIVKDTLQASSIIKREFIKGKDADIPTATASLKIPDFTIARESSLVRPSADAKTFNFVVYAGPSILENLRELKIHKVLDFGWFSGLGVLLLITLKFFYKLVQNYGLAIILLTILIKAILWWPTNKSMKSMKSMQKLQPHMSALKEKYKNNSQQLNQEVLKLYKGHKVNPLGGCLPMILQIPIFYALYMILVNAVELKDAPFYFWIRDLSVKDPYYVLPILMGITMLIQQKMTPTADPNQAKMMMILPIVFTFMFINLPAGVVFYWVVQNILSIIQQFYINKQT